MTTELLRQETVVVAGCGEIGSPIYHLCRSGFQEVLVEDPRYPEPSAPSLPVAALHVAIPGSLPRFVEIVGEYIAKYAPRVVLVHSSTLPGTTDLLVERFGADLVVHSQVHGKHHGGRMRRDMLRHPKFVATTSDLAFDRASDVLVAMGHAPSDIVRLSSPKAGELTKLLATTFFGYLIAWAQEMERLSDQSGVPYEDLMAFTRLATDDFHIDNKFPGVIGGHCVMPNIAILRRSYPSPVWDMLVQSNALKMDREDNRKAA